MGNKKEIEDIQEANKKLMSEDKIRQTNKHNTGY